MSRFDVRSETRRGRGLVRVGLEHEAVVGDFSDRSRAQDNPLDPVIRDPRAIGTVQVEEDVAAVLASEFRMKTRNGLRGIEEDHVVAAGTADADVLAGQLHCLVDDAAAVDNEPCHDVPPQYLTASLEFGSERSARRTAGREAGQPPVVVRRSHQATPTPAAIEQSSAGPRTTTKFQRTAGTSGR